MKGWSEYPNVLWHFRESRLWLQNTQDAGRQSSGTIVGFVWTSQVCSDYMLVQPEALPLCFVPEQQCSFAHHSLLVFKFPPTSLVQRDFGTCLLSFGETSIRGYYPGVDHVLSCCHWAKLSWISECNKGIASVWYGSLVGCSGAVNSSYNVLFSCLC